MWSSNMHMTLSSLKTHPLIFQKMSHLRKTQKKNTHQDTLIGV